VCVCCVCAFESMSCMCLENIVSCRARPVQTNLTELCEHILIILSGAKMHTYIIYLTPVRLLLASELRTTNGVSCRLCCSFKAFSSHTHTHTHTRERERARARARARGKERERQCRCISPLRSDVERIFCGLSRSQFLYISYVSF
jgi:hypothetical protein